MSRNNLEVDRGAHLDSAGAVGDLGAVERVVLARDGPDRTEPYRFVELDDRPSH